jgi:hypothetical protein
MSSPAADRAVKFYLFLCPYTIKNIGSRKNSPLGAGAQDKAILSIALETVPCSKEEPSLGPQGKQAEKGPPIGN